MKNNKKNAAKILLLAIITIAAVIVLITSCTTLGGILNTSKHDCQTEGHLFSNVRADTTQHWKTCVYCNEEEPGSKRNHSGNPCSCGYQPSTGGGSSPNFDR